MRILKYDDFLKEPNGTVYMDYRPCVFGQLAIKTSGPEFTGDFYVMSLEGNLGDKGATESNGGSEEQFALIDRVEDGEALPLFFDTAGREGMYDHTALYAVLDPDDVDRLIAVLQRSKLGDFK
jgi:hypothetical protein